MPRTKLSQLLRKRANDHKRLGDATSQSPYVNQVSSKRPLVDPNTTELSSSPAQQESNERPTSIATAAGVPKDRPVVAKSDSFIKFERANINAFRPRSQRYGSRRHDKNLEFLRAYDLMAREQEEGTVVMLETTHEREQDVPTDRNREKETAAEKESWQIKIWSSMMHCCIATKMTENVHDDDDQRDENSMACSYNENASLGGTEDACVV